MNHKRITLTGTIFILAMVVILVGVVPASAQAERIYFKGEDCPTYMGPPEKQWVSDGILHMRGMSIITKLTYSQYFDTNTIVANMDVNLATGERHGYGMIEIHSGEGNGTWVGRFNTHFYADGTIQGSAVAQGTGDFEGMTVFNSISAPAAPDPACLNANTVSDGYILIHN